MHIHYTYKTYMYMFVDVYNMAIFGGNTSVECIGSITLIQISILVINVGTLRD